MNEKECLSFKELSCTTLTTSGNYVGFVNSVTVWINKPHVVNRRLCGSKIKYFQIHSRNYFRNCDINNILIDLGYSLYRSSAEFEACHNVVNDTLDEVSALSTLSEDEVAVIVREMIPKQPERHRNMPELIIFYKQESSFCFYPLKPIGIKEDWLEVAYKFIFSNSPNPSINLASDSDDLSCDSQRKLSQTWIQTQLLKKLARWSEEPNLKTSLTSLKLIPLEEYSRLYSELKNKYGLHFAQIWPEKTDPQKYVFEDVAIATYLLLLWKQDRERKGIQKKQSFVDLGCGNGLLVHILASEGHPGYGIDLRRRNIWDLYGPETDLREATVTPSTESVYPDSDWLIGNHSDELTPWIPVMAARSAYTCCYFVLPCCHYDFNCKFSHDTRGSRGNSVEDGQYRSYLNFVSSVGEVCGFNVEEDMLRIPSTKRICFIGRTRKYQPNEESVVDKIRQDFISARCNQKTSVISQSDNRALTKDQTHATCVSRIDKTKENDVQGSQWVSDFTPREKVEVSRNCVSIRAETKQTVINTVFEHILEAESVSGEKSDDSGQRHDGLPWRRGGCLPLGDVVGLFDKLLLQELKSECGGLQTLLRNSSNIFQVSSGTVRLRDFTQEDPFIGRRSRGKPGDRSEFFKTAQCWFHDNHPDGCPRVAEKCLYAHGENELREKPPKINNR